MRDRMIALLKTVDNMRMMRQSIEECADYLLANDVIALPYRIKLPEELWRHMFDENNRAVAVKCKVGKITEYGFSLIHYRDGREWDYKYSALGETVFYSQEAVEKMIEERKLNEWLNDKPQ